MCGITGLIAPNGVSKYVWELFLNVWESMEMRGTDASGIAIWLDDGRFFIVKQPVPASILSAKIAKLRIPLNDVRVVIAHARAATSGTPLNNENNHPIYEVLGNELIAIVHNGHVYSYKLSKKREVDTDYFLGLVRDRKEFNDDVIRDTLDVITGSYAILLSNGKSLYFARNSNPLEIIQFDDGSVLFASQFYEHVIGKELKQYVHSVEPYKLFKIDANDGEVKLVSELTKAYTFTYAYGYGVKSYE